MAYTPIAIFCPQGPEEGLRYLGAGITGRYELPNWVLGMELGSLKEQLSVLDHRAVSPASQDTLS